MPNNEPERPRSEPEIIPPDRIHDDELRRAARVWTFGDGGGYHRVYVARIGPLGMFLLALASGLAAVFLLFFIIGAFLLWIPIVGFLVFAAIISGLLRNFFRPR